MKERKNVFVKETVTVCDKCSGHMMYKGGGCYVCESCGEEYLTDFGKVKRFINTYGPSNAITISRETGVSRHKIQEFLRDGRVKSWRMQRIRLPSAYPVVCQSEVANTVISARAAWQEKHPVKKVFIMRWQTVLLTSRKVR